MHRRNCNGTQLRSSRRAPARILSWTPSFYRAASLKVAQALLPVRIFTWIFTLASRLADDIFILMLTEKYYKRTLPHWQKPNRSIFLTWRLFGSLPDSFHPVPSAKPNGPGAQFLHLDRCLDAACFGPQWLKDPRIARIVVAAINRGERDLHHYSIVAFTVMSNHVHLLIRPLVPLREIAKGLKGSTARHTNALLGLTGSPF